MSSSSPPSSSALPTFSLADVAAHATESDAWIAVDGKVYDVTDFLDAHPGGKRILAQHLGKDATKQFALFHNLDSVAAKYDSKLVIGTLVGRQEKEPYSSEGPFGSMIAFADPAWYQDWESPFHKESHRKLRAWARTLIESLIIPHVFDWEQADHMPADVQKQLGAAGFLAGLVGVHPWPAGGIGGVKTPPAGVPPAEWDLFHELILCDELARSASLGIGVAINLGPSIALPAVTLFAPAWMRDKIEKEVLAGDRAIALAITEPYAGSDVANITASAVLEPDGTHYLLNGEKKWITNGAWADYFVVAARTGGPGMTGISLLLVERSAGGVHSRKMHCQGSACAGTAFVTFENVRVPKRNLIGEENKGFKCIMQNFNHERIGIVISALRFSRICFEDALVHAHRRRTFGKLLFDHGVIRNKLAHMARQIEATQAWLDSILYQMMTMKPEKASVLLAGPTALLKAQSTVCVEYCAREASQIFGGLGYTKGGLGERVERIYRNVRGIAIPGGSEEIMLDLGSRQALKVSKYLGAKI
ncbi:acyl-dehydrogenase domain-containing protein [Zopfochytrium polystomum]|nr:acyl-dehydrogenase domain-containing protein [Zopfochytrium polystomum]